MQHPDLDFRCCSVFRTCSTRSLIVTLFSGAGSSFAAAVPRFRPYLPEPAAGSRPFPVGGSLSRSSISLSDRLFYSTSIRSPSTAFLTLVVFKNPHTATPSFYRSGSIRRLLRFARASFSPTFESVLLLSILLRARMPPLSCRWRSRRPESLSALAPCSFSSLSSTDTPMLCCR